MHLGSLWGAGGSHLRCKTKITPDFGDGVDVSV